MPNHVRNILDLSGPKKDIEKLFNTVITYKREHEDANVAPELDFQKIIPMPGELSIESAPNGRLGVEYLNGDEKAIRQIEKMDKDQQEEVINLGREYIENSKNHGFQNWYHWAIHSWGTKWSAYWTHISDDNTSISFSTAWSTPEPIIVKLSEMFPDIEFTHRWADEAWGSNVGKIIFLNGESIDVEIPENCSIRAYELLFEVDPSAKENFQLINGQYLYIDDE